MPALDELLERRDGVSVDRHTLNVEDKFLLGELPRRVVVLERDLGPGNAQVLGFDVQPRQRNELFDLLFEVADRDQSGLGNGARRSARGLGIRSKPGRDDRQQKAQKTNH